MCKTCKECKQKKFFKEFHSNKRMKDGYLNICRKCVWLQTKFNPNRKEKIKKSNQKYYQNNKETFKKINKTWKTNNPAYFKEYFQKNHIFKPIKTKEEKIKQKKEYLKQYWLKNKHVTVLRNLMKNTKEKLNTNKQNTLIVELKYTPLQFKNHIENQFTKGMTWNNLSNKKDGWNVDHKIPLSWFKNETPNYIVNHLFNLQPLWKKDNLKKSNKYYTPVNEEYYLLIKKYIKEKHVV